LHAQLLGISASNPFSQKTFADSLKLSYPLLSDYPDLEVIRQYGMLQHVGEAKRPMAKGAFFPSSLPSRAVPRPATPENP
jgi:peroxiredoxin